MEETLRVAIQGESGDVVGETIDSWKERLPEILRISKGRTYIISMKPDAFGGLSRIEVLVRRYLGIWVLPQLKSSLRARTDSLGSLLAFG